MLPTVSSGTLRAEMSSVEFADFSQKIPLAVLSVDFCQCLLSMTFVNSFAKPCQKISQ